MWDFLCTFAPSFVERQRLGLPKLRNFDMFQSRRHLIKVWSLTYWIYRIIAFWECIFDHFGLKNHYYLHIPNFCCTFAATKVKTK